MLVPVEYFASAPSIVTSSDPVLYVNDKWVMCVCVCMCKFVPQYDPMGVQTHAHRHAIYIYMHTLYAFSNERRVWDHVCTYAFCDVCSESYSIHK